jgi:hypothetical protein
LGISATTQLTPSSERARVGTASQNVAAQFKALSEEECEHHSADGKNEVNGRYGFPQGKRSTIALVFLILTLTMITDMSLESNIAFAEGVKSSERSQILKSQRFRDHGLSRLSSHQNHCTINPPAIGISSQNSKAKTQTGGLEQREYLIPFAESLTVFMALDYAVTTSLSRKQEWINNATARFGAIEHC